jgi:hypothetical protein
MTAMRSILSAGLWILAGAAWLVVLVAIAPLAMLAIFAEGLRSQ